MNILGMGPAELLLIFVIALIVLGPGKLPEIARTLGKAVRELRRMSMEVTAEFAKELRDMEAISQEVKDTAQTIQQVADVKKTLMESVEPALLSAESTHRTAESEVQGTPTRIEAEKTDPVGGTETP